MSALFIEAYTKKLIEIVKKLYDELKTGPKSLIDFLEQFLLFLRSTACVADETLHIGPLNGHV